MSSKHFQPGMQKDKYKANYNAKQSDNQYWL